MNNKDIYKEFKRKFLMTNDYFRNLKEFEEVWAWIESKLNKLNKNKH